jgi:hypothetical protein
MRRNYVSVHVVLRTFYINGSAKATNGQKKEKAPFPGLSRMASCFNRVNFGS